MIVKKKDLKEIKKPNLRLENVSKLARNCKKKSNRSQYAKKYNKSELS